MKDTGNDAERGKRIVYVRTSILNLRSQAAFADWLGGVTRGAVGNWERGKDISLDNLALISRKASIAFDWLAFGTGPKPSPADPSQRDADKPKALEQALSIFDALPADERKEFLRRALGLEELDRSRSAAPVVPTKDEKEPR